MCVFMKLPIAARNGPVTPIYPSYTFEASVIAAVVRASDKMRQNNPLYDVG